MLLYTYVGVLLCYFVPILLSINVVVYLFVVRANDSYRTRVRDKIVVRGGGIVVEIWGSLKGVKKLFLPLEKLLQLCTIRITYLLYLLTLRQRLP